MSKYALCVLVSLVASLAFVFSCGDSGRTCVVDEECPLRAECVDGVCEECGDGCASLRCATDDDCPEVLRCSPDSNTCVQCLDSTECLPQETCFAGRCQEAECDGDEDCPPFAPICLSDEVFLGVCTDCTVAGCAAGLICAGSPSRCVACEDDDEPSGSPCFCDEECATGLFCIDGRCGERCGVDETCGSLECRHQLLTPPACREPSLACVGDRSLPLDRVCACNADCNEDAPLCLEFTASGSPGFFLCSRFCSDDDPCPEGYSCCGMRGQERYCLGNGVAIMTAASCRYP